MLLTEDEARTKWCPHVRQPSMIVMAAGPPLAASQQPVSSTAFGINREIHACGPSIARCIASDCMMWRWEGEDSWTTRQKERQQGEPLGETLGFCGLAGKPVTA